MNPLFTFRRGCVHAVLACVASGVACAAEPSPGFPGDGPAKVHRTIPLQFPVRLARDGIKQGDAHVVLEIDASSKITDALIVAYTHPLFAEESLQTIKRWRFEPARVDGHGADSVVDHRLSFEINGMIAVERVASPPLDDARFFSALQYQPHAAASLDRAPVASHVVAPVYRKVWMNEGLGGQVIVDFYIDETGRPRIPTVVSSSHPLLSGAAVAAVREWRFEPPMANGKRVLARAQQVFNFEPNTKAGARR